MSRTLAFSHPRIAYNDQYEAARKRRRINARNVQYVRSGFIGPMPRPGYPSVPRSRGASVTGEMKYFDSHKPETLVAVDRSWVASVYDPNPAHCLFSPVQGPGVDERIGKSVKVLKLKVRGTIICAAQEIGAIADAATKVRILLCMDKQTNAAQMLGSDLMTTSIDDINGVNIFQNVNNFGRFNVLKDKTVIIDSPPITFSTDHIVQGGVKKDFKFSYSWPNALPIRFNGVNGASVGSIVDHSFHIVANVDNDQLAPTMAYTCRTYYKE